VKKPILLLFLSGLFLFSCSGTEELSSLQKLQKLEFSREDSPEKYQQFLVKQEDETNYYLARTVARVQSDKLTPIATELAQSPNQRVRAMALFALGQIGDSLACEALIERFRQTGYADQQGIIIRALGRCGEKPSAELLMSGFEDLPDSLKALTLNSLTFIYSRNHEFAKIPVFVGNLLDHPAPIVRERAFYFFSRSTEPENSKLLLRGKNLTQLGRKYRFRAINRLFTQWSPDLSDSAMVDSFRTDLHRQLTQKNYQPELRYYQTRILSNFTDSVSIDLAANLISADNVHIRFAAIETLGNYDSPVARHALLDQYDSCKDWNEKGQIVLALSSYNPSLAHSLIQQNLDQGTPYFKQLLLQALVRLNDPVSVNLVKQFLNVRDRRLRIAAFTALDNISEINYPEARLLLESADLAMTWLAANWIRNNPRDGATRDLVSVYSKFTEPDGIETMQELLDAIAEQDDLPPVEFLKSVYDSSASPLLANRAATMLERQNITVAQKPAATVSLFVPDTVVNKGRYRITLETSRGTVSAELWPEIAPATVATFVHLARTKFYDGLAFHRVVSDFVVQGGDPRGDGWGGPGFSIPCEYSDLPYQRGSIGIATAGKDTGSSQFFICHSEQPHLSGRYTVFGKVLEGMDVIDQIEIDDVIKSITVQYF
jgi:cyclophilin family peptidyl-prolyl cis-trans isomerase/HEAT repeat protein